MARMAPSWNKAGEWFIQGRDFVAQHGYANAIKMNLCVNKEEIYASISGTVVYSSPLQIEDLNLSRQEILDILKSTEMDGHGVELQDSWCHVLPSMKKGRVRSVSLLIPRESPFTCYADLKRYWKNTYGYRLPQTDEDMFYCQVSFSPSGNGKQFTYPDVCLRNCPVQPKNRIDPKPILTAFLQDIHSRVGSVCGQALRFIPKMHFPTVSLHDANEKEPHMNVNLTNKRRIDKPVPLRSSQNILSLNKKHENPQPPMGSRKPVVDIKENTIAEQNGERGGNTRLPCTSSSSSLINNSKTPICQDDDNTILSPQTKKCHTNVDENENKKSSNSVPVPAIKKILLVNHQNTSVNSNNNMRDEFNPLSQPNKNSPSSSSKLKLPHTGQTNSGEKTLIDKCRTPTSVNHKCKTLFAGKDKSKNLPVNPSPSHCQSQPSQPASSHRFVPIFRAKQNIVTNYQKTKEKNPRTDTDTTPKITPIFKAKQRSSASTIKSSQSSAIQRNTSNPMSKHNQVPNPTSVPTSKGISNLSAVQTSTNPPIATNPTVPLFSSQAPRSSSALPNHSLVNSSQLSTNSPQTPKTNKLFSLNEADSKMNLSLPGSEQRKPFPTFKSQGSKYPSLPSPKSFGLKSNVSSQVGNPSQTVAPVHHTPTSLNKTPLQGKRMLQQPDSDTPKKARCKPQLQHLDIEALARSNQLDKGNTLTLQTWLKERGISCKARDKKSVLIDKILLHLNLSGPET